MKTHQKGGFRSANELMRDNLLVKHYAGSHAYGTALPSSDVDFRGIFCGDPVNIRTPFFNVRECEDKTEEDTKYYELAHFMKLCLDCNPNIIETLWVEFDSLVKVTEAYGILRTARHEMLSSKIAFTTSGYAMAQLKRIKGHNKWINNPQPEEPPVQINYTSLVQWFGEEKIMPRDFKFWHYRDNHRLVPYGGDLYGLYLAEGFETFDSNCNLNTTFEGDRQYLPNPLALLKFNKKEYREAKENHRQYWTWKYNRNKKRGELEEEHGYDTKHAMHLVRLMRMGVEALRDGYIIVKRPDAEELLAIRNGTWSYEELIKYAEDMDDQVRNVWYKKTELRKKPNLKFAATLLMNVQDSIWSNND